MEPVIAVGLLWVLFGGTHIGLASGRIRAALVGRLGERGFNAFFSLIAAITIALLVAGYADRRFDGPPGLDLGSIPVARWTLVLMIAGASVLTVAGLFDYPRSAYAMFVERTPSEPRGFERITRHPFFFGMAMFAVAHALLATRLVGAVFFGGFALFSLVGAWQQDVKLRRRRGPSYDTFLAATSTLPFAAIAAGRQRLVVSELPVLAMAAGVAVALGLRAVHADILAHHGLYVIGTLVGGAALALVQTRRRERRREVQHA